jgi:hypothetical protein
MLAGLLPSWLRPAPPKVHAMRVGAHNLNPPKPTIRILMLETKKGAPDGITTVDYEAGKIYDVPEDLAACFFSTHSADPAEAHELAQGGVLPKGGPYLVGTGDHEYHIPLDTAAEETHSEAEQAATEQQDDAAGGPIEDDRGTGEDRPARRSRGPRRIHGQ